LVAASDAQPGLDAVLATDSVGFTSVLDDLVTGAVARDSRSTLDVDTPETPEQTRHTVKT